MYHSLREKLKMNFTLSNCSKDVLLKILTNVQQPGINWISTKDKMPSGKSNIIVFDQDTKSICIPSFCESNEQYHEREKWDGNYGDAGLTWVNQMSDEIYFSYWAPLNIPPS